MLGVRFAILFLLATGCATPARTLPLELDAANPDAEETPARAALTPMTVPVERPQPSPPPASHGHGAAYVCPMHPEVISPTQGRCPKCGMDLSPVSK
jgi:hypothetical protein